MGLLKSFLAAALTWFFALSCLSNGAIAGPSNDGNDIPNFFYCNTQNATEGSTLLKNVKAVLDYLVERDNSTNVSGSYPDDIYGVSECYTPGNCSQCLNGITKSFSTQCPLAVGARVYLVYPSYSCFLRYENYKIFPGPSNDGYNTPYHVFCNTQNVTEGSTLLKNVRAVLDYLVGRPNSTHVFGSYPDTIYGVSECYPPGNCSQCLSGITESFSTICPLAVGAREYVVNSSYSCFLRYENYFFSDMNTTSLSPAASPTSVNNTSSQASASQGTRSKSNRSKVILGVVVPSVVLLLAGAAWATYAVFCKPRDGKPIPGDLQDNLDVTRVYRYEELRVATEGFADHKKLGQGGFGAVYKAVLQDGREVAVKKLLLESNKRRDEFVNEVKIISSIQHRNLVRLEGYCVQAKQRLLVLEYVVNGSLEKALFGIKNTLDWPTRRSIILGIAQGLGYLHEESHFQIIHRDIKASNVLLDNKLNPKIADFGISKLYDKDSSFTTTTEIGGTYGYLAPEYAIGGKLNAKIDVFSFGVLVLEIVSGRRCNDPSLLEDQQLLLEWAWNLQSNGSLEDLIDPRLGLSLDSSKLEALKAFHIALLCTQAEAVRRPTMSVVVAMLLDYHEILPLPEQRPAYLSWLRQMRISNATGARGSLYESTSILEPR